jgi:hypothetical protein
MDHMVDWQYRLLGLDITLIERLWRAARGRFSGGIRNAQSENHDDES